MGMNLLRRRPECRFASARALLQRPAVTLLLVAALSSSLAAQSSLTVNRIIWVQATGTTTDNCKGLRDILAGIAGTTSEANSYVVRLEPGRYDCGPDTVTVPSYVTLEGSGENVTWIVGSKADPRLGVVDIPDAFRAAVRSVSIGNSANMGDTVTLSVFQSRDIHLDHVRLSPVAALAGGVSLWVGSHSGSDTADVDVRESWLGGMTSVRTEELGGGFAKADLISSLLVSSVDTSLGGLVRCVGSFNAGLTPRDASCGP